MRIDGQSVIGTYNKDKTDKKLRVKSRDEVKSREDYSDRELKELKRDGVRRYGLDDFLPKQSKGKITTIIDRVDLSASSVSQSLEITAQQIADKIKEVMGKEYPGYEASYAPEDNTSEKISNNIVSGATALFGIYASQNKNLQGEELINSFMNAIRGGVEKGYSQAKNILGEIGALKVPGVEDAISETMRLVEVGFKNFESQYRKENGLAPLVEEPKPEQSDPPESTPSITQ